MTRSTRNSARKKTNIKLLRASSKHQEPAFRALSMLVVPPSTCILKAAVASW
uniref:Glycine cleavage system H protein 1 n=1 Tax=Arundo donax TaxID=35708 RepID=A0A0A9FLJ0_ARUDO